MFKRNKSSVFSKIKNKTSHTSHFIQGWNQTSDPFYYWEQLANQPGSWHHIRRFIVNKVYFFSVTMPWEREESLFPVKGRERCGSTVNPNPVQHWWMSSSHLSIGTSLFILCVNLLPPPFYPVFQSRGRMSEVPPNLLQEPALISDSAVPFIDLASKCATQHFLSISLSPSHFCLPMRADGSN